VSPQQTSVTRSSGPLVSVTTGPQVSGSEVIDPHIFGLSALDSTSSSQSSCDGVEQGESPPWDTTSERRNPKWLQDTLKEAQGYVGNPK
jgi:hypothetical protein